MATRLTRHVGKTASGVGLALAVALTIGLGGIQAQQTDADNYFDRFTIPAGERTEGDANDPYAPIDLGPSVVTDSGSLRRSGFTINGVEVDGASLAATEPLAVVETWIEGHRIARQDVNLLAADAVLEVAGLPPLVGPAEIVAFVDAFYGAIGGREVTVEVAIASGGEVAGLLRVRGTHAGLLLGVPATGNPVDFLLTAFVEVRDGKIVRIRAVFDAAGLMTQIGVLPAPERPATRLDIRPRDLTV